MPVFEYGCSACGFKQDCLRKADEIDPIICPQCEAGVMARQLSAPTLVRGEVACPAASTCASGPSSSPCSGGCPRQFL